jgi:hypothetical protein
VSLLDEIAAALAEVKRARKTALQGTTPQLTQREPLEFISSVCHAWFRNHRPAIAAALPSLDLSAVDESLTRTLTATTKASARSTYKIALADAADALVTLQAIALIPPVIPVSDDAAPDFSNLAGDPTMRAILIRRWDECQKCIRAEAFLATTIMMGGLLEALFVARANRLTDKSPLFKAKKTPLDAKTKKPLPLQEWTLRPYIDVGHELGWITKSGADVAAILRDYRNYVHPEKERSHGIVLSSPDVEMFWSVTKILVKQLLAVT